RRVGGAVSRRSHRKTNALLASRGRRRQHTRRAMGDLGRAAESCEQRRRREPLRASGREWRAFSSESVANARGMAHERDAPKSPPRRWLELFAISRVERAGPVLVKYGCFRQSRSERRSG